MKRIYKIIIPLLLLLSFFLFLFTSCTPQNPKKFIEKFQEAKSFHFAVTFSYHRLEFTFDKKNYYLFDSSKPYDEQINYYIKSDTGYNKYVYASAYSKVFTLYEITEDEFESDTENIYKLFDKFDPNDCDQLVKSIGGWVDSSGFLFVIDGLKMTISGTLLYFSSLQEFSMILELKGYVNLP